MNRKGFTLIELLIVVVIIGILAAIAIPKFATTKEKAYYASMKSDLRNLVTANEAFFADSGRYFANAGEATGSLLWTPTTNVSIAAYANDPAIRSNWTASVSHLLLPAGKACFIFIGTATNPPALKEGEPKCN